MTTSRISGSVTDLAVERARRNKSQKTSSAAPKAAQDTLSISPEAALLQKAEAIAAATPDVDMQKVEEVRQAMLRGELKMNYEKLAQKMMDFESLLEP